jgi:hypothetical protein
LDGWLVKSRIGNAVVLVITSIMNIMNIMNIRSAIMPKTTKQEKIEVETPTTEKLVEIYVQGGRAEVTRNDGVNVKITDYDNSELDPENPEGDTIPEVNNEEPEEELHVEIEIGGDNGDGNVEVVSKDLGVHLIIKDHDNAEIPDDKDEPEDQVREWEANVEF